MTYHIFTRKLAPEDGGGWLAKVPALPGCMGDGDTEAEAVADAELAIVGWLETAEKLGKDIPTV